MREKEKGICKIKREQERIIEDATSYRIHANMHPQRHARFAAVHWDQSPGLLYHGWWWKYIEAK